MLPPLLHGSGAFGDLRRAARDVRDGAPSRRGRHAGLTSVPHGAKTYLAAALASGATGERLVWIARDAEIGDRVAEELQAWLGDPSAVAVLEPRTALAYERSELVPDETAARVAALAAWKSGRARVLVASVQALLQHTIDPSDLPEQAWLLRPGARVAPEQLLRRLFDLGYVPVFEVAGRGEFARRGGIVDVFPPTSTFPVRIEFFGDEIDSIRSFDPTDQRTIGKRDRRGAAAGEEFLLPEDGVADVRARLRGAGTLGERLTADLERFGTRAAGGARASATTGPIAASATRRKSGRPSSLQPPASTTSAPDDPARPRRTRRHRRKRRVPVAPGRRTARRDDRRGRPAEELAVDVSRAPWLEGPARRIAHPRADLGIRGARRDGRRRPVDGRRLRLA